MYTCTLYFPFPNKTKIDIANYTTVWPHLSGHIGTGTYMYRSGLVIWPDIMRVMLRPKRSLSSVGLIVFSHCYYICTHKSHVKAKVYVHVHVHNK